ncbi:uncharacterized protein LOC133930126 [Phragmites australis]|uniref:uncharacterized protein LOC133930126 n=1 Tax=Phragmites australis TaxID=29695 RepID=UPI002D781C16|nr:uncharacterized protein LOC133930126 [Phragmites australis]
MGKDIRSFPLPEIDEAHDTASGVPREIFEESTIELNVEDATLLDSLNTEQRAAYDEILSAVDSDEGIVFFVDGPGGTEKTFLYKALLAMIRGFTKQSEIAKLLQTASLIIWDEASMTKRQAVEALDNNMRDIMSRPELSFGGKTVVFGGDFRQVLPVVRKGSRAQIIDALLHRNIDPANGLCNGTRLVVRGFQRNAIDAEIMLGQHAGKRIFLPRIPLCPSDDEMFPFQFKRKQFPVRLSFAMTVNKAQGQTIPIVGIYLPEPVFSHG